MRNRALRPLKQFEAVQNSNKRFFKKHIISWFRQNGRHFPWRETDNPYHVLIAEIFLQQTDATKVSLIYNDFLRMYPDIKGNNIVDSVEKGE